MTQVGIVTDSSSCLPPELVMKYNIQVVPLGLVINGKAHRDQVDITSEEFHRIYTSLENIPTTTATPVGDFVDIFSKLAEVTENIVCIVLSKGLSATWESANQAREILGNKKPGLNIAIIDSRTTTGALGFIALEAARAASAGKKLADVVKVAEDMVSRVKFILALDTLKYLVKSGRAPKGALVANLIHVKPIVGMVSMTGLVESLGKAIGKNRSLRMVNDLLKEYTDIKQPLHLIVHYSNNISDGQELKELVTSRYKCAEVYMIPITPVVACTGGPLAGIAFYS
jgi:DegV family protein with EDD domain